MNNIFKLVIAVVIAELAGVLGSIFTIPSIPTWYAGLNKPELIPPSWVFGPVWTILFLLIGISLYLVWKNNWQIKNRLIVTEKKPWNRWSERFWRGDLTRQNIIAVFAVQWILNVLWSFIFFGLRSPDWAFFTLIALWCSIVYVIVNFYRVSKTAAWLLLPYLIWVSFAGYLNFYVWVLN